MKKIIRLTERDLTRIVRRVINEVETPMNPESGNRGIKSQGIKPELVKVLIRLAEDAFPLVRSAIHPVPFKKLSNKYSTVYQGKFSPQNTPALKKNYNVPYEGIGHAEVYFDIVSTGPNAGIFGQVTLNTFSFSARLTADELNMYTPNDLYGQSGIDGIKTPGGLIRALANQYTGIRNGAGKSELIQRLKEEGFKQES